MSWRERVEKAFAGRVRPAEMIDGAVTWQLDDDVAEAEWFAGRDWREITWKDWAEHPSAVIFFSREAFGYFLPGVMALSGERPEEELEAVQTLIWELDRTPDVEGWNEHFERRWLGLRDEEYEVLKEWLLLLCGAAVYLGSGLAAAGEGETFGRAFETVNLLQMEAKRRDAGV